MYLDVFKANLVWCYACKSLVVIGVHLSVEAKLDFGCFSVHWLAVHLAFHFSKVILLKIWIPRGRPSIVIILTSDVILRRSSVLAIEAHPLRFAIKIIEWMGSLLQYITRSSSCQLKRTCHGLISGGLSG